MLNENAKGKRLRISNRARMRGFWDFGLSRGSRGMPINFINNPMASVEADKLPIDT